mmetsp:Transcript_82460/g.267105  ORF Transcript_82460/g.267105 Transcript_82460/m.267105 type:complete len:521 (+) Transcript_82460:408-1970(+)
MSPTSPSKTRSQGSSPLQRGAASERCTSDNDFVPLASLAVASYLEAYGYCAADAEAWKVRPGQRLPGAWSGGAPRLELRVSGHEELDGKTFYRLSCSLSNALVRADWTALRRLTQLREDLHDAVKHDLGPDAYTVRFANAPFAHHGGLRGTTARLDAWFQAFAGCINGGTAKPSLVALTLYFLEAPVPEEPTSLVLSLDTAGNIRSQALRLLDKRGPKEMQDGGGSDDSSPPKSLPCSPSTSKEEFCLDDIELCLDGPAAGCDAGGSGGLLLRFRLPDASERLVDFASHRPPLGVDFMKTSPLRVLRVHNVAERMGVQPGWELIGINGTKVDTWTPVEAFRLMKTCVPGPINGRSSSHHEGGSQEIGPKDGVELGFASGSGSMLCSLGGSPGGIPSGASSRFRRREEFLGSPSSASSAVGQTGGDGGPAAARVKSMDIRFLLPDGSEREVSFAGEVPPLGLTFRRKMPITVKTITPDSPSERLGIEADWIVKALNGEDISSGLNFDTVFEMLTATLSGRA